jgi:hypothetical protein
VRQAVAARLHLGITHALAGVCHDEGGLQGDGDELACRCTFFLR